MNIRKANETDTDFFIEIQNYPLVNFFDSTEKEILSEWFEQNIEDHLIIEVDGKRAGILAVEKVTAISVAIKPEFRRMKLASNAVYNVIRDLGIKTFAFIDNDNSESKSFFKSLGFKKERFDCFSSN